MNNLENLVIYFSNLSAFYIFSIAISVAVVILTVYLGWITRSEDAAKNYDPMEDHSKVQNECEESSEDESLRIESMGQLKSARIRSLENTLTNEQREEEKKKSRLWQRNKMLIYKQVFRTAIMYAVPIWSTWCATRKKAIQRIQNKVLKMILRLPPWHSTEDLHRIAGIESIEEIANKIISNFRGKSMQSSIAEIRSLYN
ncbi:uncharacterized protein LOC129741788 isoform X1 [Uranotaenia lowii]|uniref:uncharacterized protein LOC129741788 isoform X1 n=1 Tax=Uranotaenia lowii TaxID=190385 RepID=UPI002479AAB7|nr:uncharacterized protein LOC129741788 isoform X1 [Uranotaenia lowii]